MKLNDKRRTILAIGAVSIILAVMFFVPWRLKSSNDIAWAPIYRPPVTYSQTYATARPSARYSYAEADVHVGFFLLEILAIAGASAVGYMLASAGEANDREGAAS